jgi:CheY-like chemotaxis protein
MLSARTANNGSLILLFLKPPSMKSPEYVIILADDDLDDQLIIKEIFSLHSSHVRMMNVLNGQETLHLLERLQQKNVTPCLVILDINMPRLNGRQTLLCLKQDERLKNIPVVLFSTSNTESDRAFAQAHGANYVTKPFNYKSMEIVVKDFIRLCEAEGEKRSAATLNR